MDRLTFTGVQDCNVPTKKADNADTDVQTNSANNEGDSTIDKDSIVEIIDTHESVAATINEADLNSVVDPRQRTLTVPQVGTGSKHSKLKPIEVIQSTPKTVRVFRTGNGEVSVRGECDETTTGDPSCVIRQRP